MYVKVDPTWVISKDGMHPSGGPEVTRKVARWTRPERKLQVLFHIRFWTSVLRGKSRRTYNNLGWRAADRGGDGAGNDPTALWHCRRSARPIEVTR